MGFFKSQKSRNKRIFQETLERLENEIKQIYIEDEHGYQTYSAWFWGAEYLASWLVEEIPTIKNAWGKGDEGKAIALYEVCVQPMISVWFRKLDEQVKRPKKDKMKLRGIAISNVLNILGTYSESKIGDFLNLDIQYNWEWDFMEVHEGTPTWYATLLISRAGEACGIRGFIDWDIQAFPVKQFSDVSFIEGAPSDFTEILATNIMITQSGIAMLQYYNLTKAVQDRISQERPKDEKLE